MNLKELHQNFKQIATDKTDYNCSQMSIGTIKIINQLSDEIYNNYRVLFTLKTMRLSRVAASRRI